MFDFSLPSVCDVVGCKYTERMIFCSFIISSTFYCVSSIVNVFPAEYFRTFSVLWRNTIRRQNQLYFITMVGKLWTPRYNSIWPTRPSIHPSIYDATAPSGPWPRSKDASIHSFFQLFSYILLSPAIVMHPSGPHPPIWFLVFPLVLWCGSFRLKPFFGILSSSILTMWPAHPNLLILMTSTMLTHTPQFS